MYQDELRQLGINLVKTGRQTCPKCSDSRTKSADKCLQVTYTDEGVLYHCHHCEWSGFVPFERNGKEYYRPAEVKRDNKEVNVEFAKFFTDRKITPKVVSDYNIAVSNNEIVFPYYKNGILVNNKYRTLDKKFRQEKDTEKTLFGMDKVDTDKSLIFVEGEMDVLALASIGIYAVSIPNGGNDKDLECIENCYSFIRKFDEYIIAVDNDEVGSKLKNNLIDRLGKENCRVVDWRGYKDANEALIDGADIPSIIDDAQPVNPDDVICYEEQFDRIHKFLYEEDSDFYKTGWESLDKLIKIRTGFLMVVTGYPSRGKSTFVTNLLVNLTKNYGLKHLIASFESTSENSFIELAEMYAQETIEILKMHDEVFDNFQEISRHFYRIDVDRQWTIDDIVAKAEVMVRRYGIKTIVIDPYNRLKNDIKEREDLYVGSILSKLCMIAKKLNVLIIFVAHPKKPDGEKIPTMYSISGSSDWYNMADYGIVVHREREKNGRLSNDPKIVIGKIKNYLLGDPSGGEATLYYDINKRVLLNKRG